MPLDFYNPPSAFLASGTKKGMDIGGSKIIVSIDKSHNFYNEGNIYTEMSWAAFYEEEDLSNQIDTFTTTEYDSIREDPVALVDMIVKIIYQIINNQKIFYGIADFEVNAFLSPSIFKKLKLDYKIINKLLEAHKRTREKGLFPQIIIDDKGINKIKIEFQGTKKKNVHIHGSKLEDLINQLRLAKGFAVGIVCTSRNAANMYIISDNIVFSKDEIAEMYIDDDNIKVIEYGIKKKLLFPISWFRIDIGIRSLETLELWDQIKEDPELNKALGHYERYINALVYKKFKSQAESQKIGTDSEEDWMIMTPKERKKALRDMEKAIEILNKEYKE
ncbi:MAG: hypothetical protein E3J90_12790 [Promethearchaeota archaeon]|nr:MAG: hypothetical protein E3J90_12790 [Candidatus Lokiarchaeota archaeon]